MNKIDNLNWGLSEDLCKKHNHLRNHTFDTLNRIFASDSILHDLSSNVTYQEVQSQIAILKGESIVVYVKRDPYPKLKVIVPNNGTTVLKLKEAIKRCYERLQRRQQQRHTEKSTEHAKGRDASTLNHCEPHNKISWKYIWRTYYLELNGNILNDDEQTISHYGITNKTVLRFVKKAKETRRNRTKSKDKHRAERKTNYSQ